MNSVIYRKLVAQAEEAKEQGMTKLANGIMEAIGPEPVEEPQEYSYAQLHDDTHKEMWKVAAHLMRYYNLEYADVEKLDKSILVWASRVISDMEDTLEVDSVVVGPLEPRVPGEDK